MFTGETFSALLYAIATGYPDRARNIVLTSDELQEDERVVLWPIVDDTSTDAAEKACRLGDALRELVADDRTFANECYRLAFYLSGEAEILSANPLFAYFAAHRSGRTLDKWVHYFPIFDRHLGRYRNCGARVLEIGVFHGGSLDMWDQYLGSSTVLVGIDVDPQARNLAASDRTVLIGDQADAGFLRSVVEEHGPFDVIIDDGGHTMEQQIISVETLFPALKEGGTYIVEDCHTSYWESHGGGLGREGTFIEWVKSRIDDLHKYYLPGPIDPVWTATVGGIHCYDSVVVLDKELRMPPFFEKVGTSSFVYESDAIGRLVAEMLATRDAAITDREAATVELEVARNALSDSWGQLRSMRGTVSWRLTGPLRAVRRVMRRT